MQDFSRRHCNFSAAAGRKQKARVTLLLASFVMLLLCPRATLAHARMVRAQPADKSECSKPPALVELWFNELLEDGFNQIDVFRADQLPSAPNTTAKPPNLVEGKPALDARDHTHLTIHLKPLTPGEYVVQWRVLSRDGHSAPGRFTFKVLSSR